ncbi:MAG: molecular chaperone HtpG [Planctomycetota bacterium]|nr:molecular chaperone HtpG [Planctomycetota bacterium]
MTTDTQTHRFEAEVQDLMRLMIHSLYTEKDIFLRELISNASDACDKRRIEALTDATVLPEGTDLGIVLSVDAEARTLSVSDNGIGMSREDLVENLGTIARSGTRAFLEQLKSKDSGNAADLIGQFGVGFYSAFMVADEVEVISRRAGADNAWRWCSRADGTYTVEAAERDEVGTTVTLHMKPAAVGEDADGEPDFLQDWTLGSTVKRHSDFVEHPITLGYKTLNSRKPLWSRPAKEVTAEEHADFYRHLAYDMEPPAKVVHVKAEVPVEFTALLYIPKGKRPDFLEAGTPTSKIALYVRRVLIMADCSDLLPPWLRFVRGVVECPDLPLNVSRQTLQANPITRRIQKHLVSKVLGALGELLAEDRASYGVFFEHHGRMLKEGVYQGADDDNRLSRLCLFARSNGPETTTLPEYVERMVEGQEAIWTLAGMDRATAAASPHLEAFRAKGVEVLLMTDSVDEWMLQRLSEFEGTPLQAADQGEVDLGTEEEKAARAAKCEGHEDLLTALQAALDAHVSEVRFSSRLKDSAAVLVNAEGGASAAMERLMRDIHGSEMPTSKRILELNPDHPVVAYLEGRRATAEGLADAAQLLYGQALVAEGSPVPDPAAFARLVTELLVGRTN